MKHSFQKHHNQEIPPQEVTEQTVSAFPSASEMREKSMEHWPVLTNQEILEEIQNACNQGERRILLYKVLLSEGSKQDLKNQGYHVEAISMGEPLYRISW